MASVQPSRDGPRWTTVVADPQRTDRTSTVGDESVEIAKIFLPENEIEPETLAQVKQMAKHPAVVHCRVMPDCHKGNGCCVGFTSRLTPCMTPQLIGGDIGCGISTHPIPSKFVERKNGVEKLLKRIHEVVPMGNGHSCVHVNPLVSLEHLAPFLDDASKEWASFSEAYKGRFNVDLNAALELQRKPEQLERPPDNDARKNVETAAPFQFSIDWLKDCLKRLGLSTKDFLANLGTLGGGNHFIEVNERCESDSTGFSDAKGGNVESLPQYLLTVHSGSRCFGQAVYHYFVRMARGTEATTTRSNPPPPQQSSTKKESKKQRDDTESVAEPEGEGGDDEETIPFDTNLLLTNPAQIASYYLHMILAQKYAAVNRLVMLRSVLGSFASVSEHSRGDDVIDDGSHSQLEDDSDRSDVADNDIEEEEEEDEVSEDETEEGRTSPHSSEQGADLQQASLFSASAVVSSVHNYIDFTDLVVRKGAIRAAKGQVCLIALNMREGIWWAMGRGNEEWNGSAAHGCGRVVGRRRVQNRRQTGSKRDDNAALNKFKAEMDGVLSYSVSIDTLDERPSAYRNPTIVKAMLEGCHEGTVDIVAQFKVLASAKGK